MKKILVLGAGRSSTDLIGYLSKEGVKGQWEVMVADYFLGMAEEKTAGFSNASASHFDVHNVSATEKLLSQSDLVISLVPADLHVLVAKACLKMNKSLLTASYVTDEMRKLDQEAKEKGISIIMECGLDPGIDHMSAMKIIDEIRGKGYVIRGFESFTGGLLSPESETSNPWEYKFTWNPRNVVLAGQGTVKFIQEGKYKYIPYHRLFRRTEIIQIPEYGFFEGYGNRDSLKYRSVYGLEEIQTLYRGTLRRPGFCKSWDIFVQLGATENNYQMDHVDKMTHRDFINSFLSYNPHDSVELKLAHYLNLDLEGQEMHKLKWLGLFDHEPVGLKKGSPAQILEHILQKKWGMNSEDKDMIVMWHKFNFLEGSKEHELHAHMIVKGTNRVHTAMSKTVGLPLGITARLLLEGKINRKGVLLPIYQDIYLPVLKELEINGIVFVETLQK
jgi:saccharopine dehydrogenase (NADP+, L-glutamate forming)